MEDEDRKDHQKKLEAAINQALTESSQINTAIQDIQELGFDVFLIIEATIGFNSRDGSLSSAKQSTVRLELTTQDEKFLRSLKISPD